MEKLDQELLKTRKQRDRLAEEKGLLEKQLNMVRGQRDEVNRQLQEARRDVDKIEATLPAELDMLRRANPSKDWKAAIDAVMNILPR